jgi:hypothetical protein
VSEIIQGEKMNLFTRAHDWVIKLFVPPPKAEELMLCFKAEKAVFPMPGIEYGSTVKIVEGADSKATFSRNSTGAAYNGLGLDIDDKDLCFLELQSAKHVVQDTKVVFGPSLAGKTANQAKQERPFFKIKGRFDDPAEQQRIAELCGRIQEARDRGDWKAVNEMLNIKERT